MSAYLAIKDLHFRDLFRNNTLQAPAEETLFTVHFITALVQIGTERSKF